MRSKSQILSKLRADGHITDEEYKVLKQEPKIGHWVHGDLLFACYDTVDGESKFVRNIYAGNTCSLCGVKIGDFGTEEPYKFCPYCGYPMESEND